MDVELLNKYFQGCDLARSVSPDFYDVDYYDKPDSGLSSFYGGEYTEELRREREGELPSLVHNLFSSLGVSSVLDVGCAKGFFVKFLLEQGFSEVQGVDHSAYAINSAPVEIRDLLQIASIEKLPFSNGQFGLVVCREVMEHLSPEQIISGVKELIRVSNRFLFLDIFCENTLQAFESRTGDPLDKSHITLAPRDLWIALVQEFGLRYRADLTERLRVRPDKNPMVFEKTP